MRVLDALDDAEISARMNCRAANCGACRVRVVSGASALQPPAARERDTLAALGCRPDERLACQLRTAEHTPEARLVLSFPQ